MKYFQNIFKLNFYVINKKNSYQYYEYLPHNYQYPFKYMF